MGFLSRLTAAAFVLLIAGVSATLWFSKEPPVGERDAIRRWPVIFAWDQGREDAPLTGSFHIEVTGVYGLELLFTAVTANRATLGAFVGDGSYKFMSDASPDKRQLISGVDGSSSELNVRANRSEIVRRLARPGTSVWVQVSVAEDQPNGKVLLSDTVKTSGVSAYIAEGLLRDVAGIHLEPGNYRLSASIQPFVVPPTDIRMSVVVTPPRRY